MATDATGDGEPPGGSVIKQRRYVRAIVLTLCTIVPLAILTVSSLHLASAAVSREVEARMRSTAKVGAVAVEKEVGGVLDLVTSYAGRPVVRSAVGASDVATLVKQVAELRRSHAAISTAFIADPAGILVGIDPPTPQVVGRDFSYRDWFKGVTAAGRPYVSEAYVSMAEGRPNVVGIAAPIRADDGQGPVLAILVAGYGLGSIQSLADELAASEHMKLAVTDQRGTLLATPGGGGAGLTSMGNDRAVAAALRGRSGITVQHSDGERWLSAYVPMSPLGWALTSSVPERTAFAALARFRSAVLILAGILTLVLCAGIVLLLMMARAQQRSDDRERELAGEVRQLLESTSEGIYGVDIDGECTFVNASASQMLGRPPDEILGQKVHDLFHHTRHDGSAYEAELCPIYGVMRTGKECRIGEDLFWRADGTSFATEYSSCPLFDASGAVRGAVVAFADITERQLSRLETERARAEAERANLAKSDFLSRMSHELRTPLNAILGFGQILELDLESDADKESVRHIISGGRHLLQLINEVLDVARIESGKLSVSVEPVLVGDAIREAIELVQPLADGRGISVDYQASSGSTDHILADRQRLHQVLLNLLSNAIKYNVAGGSVTISTRRHDNSVQVDVTDTGPGIAADDLPQLFAPFDRLGAELTDVEGTGIGLTLSRSLVEIMGGALTVRSEVGVGSTFTFELPATSDQLSGAEKVLTDPALAKAPSDERKTVLCIEDNPANLRLLERIMEQRPAIRLMTATQGSLGIDIARHERPDLVLLDLHLPDLHGREVLDRLRRDPATGSVPVVVISADATTGQVARLLASGARAYLTKPIAVEECLRVLDEVLWGAAAASGPDARTSS